MKNDLISRQAAIDAVHKAVLEMFDYCDDDIEEPMTYTDEKMLEVNKLITAKIRDLPSAQPERKWIPVSERLPEDGTDIFVMYVDEEETRIIPVNYGRGTWFDCIFDRALDSLKVTAWMPLPEPWKGEE